MSPSKLLLTTIALLIAFVESSIRAVTATVAVGMNSVFLFYFFAAPTNKRVCQAPTASETSPFAAVFATSTAPVVGFSESQSSDSGSERVPS